MSVMEWSDELDTQVPQMNDQHKKLLSIMNSLHDLYRQNANFTEIKSKLDELKDFTVKHFQDEEVYMESISFPGIDSHKLIHKKLLDQFGENYHQIVAEQKLNDKFFDFLKLWLSAHIKGIDAKYGEHANK